MHRKYDRMTKKKKKKKKEALGYQKSEKIVSLPKSRVQKERKLPKIKSNYWVIAGIVALVLCIFLFLMDRCTIKTITVEGNVHYSNDEIVAMVMKNKLDHNSLYLSMKYRKKGIVGIPFIEKMSVDIVSPDSIKITVYEKAVAGYIEYLGKYMYFDKDGIIVETSDVKTAGIPQVTGLQFDYVVLHERLPIENDTMFQSILDITQLLTKYEISIDKIYFDQNNQMTLYFENIRVRLGDISNIDDKIIRLKAILPELEGQKGVLRMENYEEGMKNITFNKDS